MTNAPCGLDAKVLFLGEWVLVHAGAGGVGLAACQIAKSQCF